MRNGWIISSSRHKPSADHLPSASLSPGEVGADSAMAMTAPAKSNAPRSPF